MRDPTRLSAMAGPIGLELVLAESGTFITRRLTEIQRRIFVTVVWLCERIDEEETLIYCSRRWSLFSCMQMNWSGLLTTRNSKDQELTSLQFWPEFHWKGVTSIEWGNELTNKSLHRILHRNKRKNYDVRSERLYLNHWLISESATYSSFCRRSLTATMITTSKTRSEEESSEFPFKRYLQLASNDRSQLSQLHGFEALVS